MGEFSLGDAIRQFINSSRLKNSYQSVRMEQIWEEIMGATIAKYTDKIQVVGNTLFIHTQVAPLKQELQFQKEKIIERVNESLGEKLISEVVIR
jgi:hypothetical protein